MSDPKSPTQSVTCSACNGSGVQQIELDKTCARCHAPFHIQQGRAESKHRTKGVIYCSRACANAASQAAYREREKAKADR